ncbi:high-affinity D-ribose transport protein (ABC superfamily, atp_bind) [Candidatus Competibacter denitrificans Run_A_D11]|jgi:D-xylose transport system ATP-binding protein|uniref:High-affinity D-ribose transport protein (ABC superfamily, atp_bind) n=1 Tax=Candidatus Competibacter denitrificans Run_A_D11 TaxID=1400863 RepID=W6MDI4_9GAMM|nr:sugar ABC transporter ATP-binding protein [Candidatus Competibacter denitrificans]CDI02918.1 high-affinity D-ribose transport protein (ABC superfamily, atp_bind) [Candidatus Competibacter denitrificans Run_A_D11]HRC68657.1 sugar ABC transporter ATP-binding protein [Candidatus Competibacter denitrificans]
MGEVVLEMKNIVKDFPGVRALNDVNFEARSGELLALMGENGAGKSTLMKVLSGVWPYPTYEGDIYLRGELKRFYNTKEAEAAGIAIIYQELNLIPELTVAENIFLDRQMTNAFGAIQWSKLFAETQRLLDELNISDFKPTDKVRDLTVGKQQMVEIAKALSKKADILVFDEPTSALTDKEVAALFEIIRKLKRQGVCMSYISHKMEELQQIADRVVVLRDGKTIGPVTPIPEITLDQLISRMVGRDVKDMFPKGQFQRGEKVLEVKNFEIDNPDLPGQKKVKNASFCAYKGEILGISGLMGSGRTELVSGIFGAPPGAARGEIYLDNKLVRFRSPHAAIEHGIGLVTEDRKRIGLILGQSILQNMTISSLETVTNMLGIINESKERSLAQDYVKRLAIKTPGLDVKIDTLSGGNQQKVILAKWLNIKPKVLILDEPTRGIDVGAKVEIYNLLNKLVEEGVTVIIISSELPEVMGISDRILVMCEGEIVVELTREQATKELIMAYATGSQK